MIFTYSVCCIDMNKKQRESGEIRLGIAGFALEDVILLATAEIHQY